MQERSTWRLGRFRVYTPISLLGTRRVPRILNSLSGYRACLAVDVPVGPSNSLVYAIDEQLTTSWRLIWLHRFSLYMNAGHAAHVVTLCFLLLFWGYVAIWPYFPAAPPSDVRAFPVSALDGDRATDVDGRTYRVESLCDRAPLCEAVPLLREHHPTHYVAVRVLE